LGRLVAGLGPWLEGATKEEDLYGYEDPPQSGPAKKGPNQRAEGRLVFKGRGQTVGTPGACANLSAAGGGPAHQARRVPWPLPNGPGAPGPPGPAYYRHQPEEGPGGAVPAVSGSERFLGRGRGTAAGGPFGPIGFHPKGNPTFHEWPKPLPPLDRLSNLKAKALRPRAGLERGQGIPRRLHPRDCALLTDRRRE